MPNHQIVPTSSLGEVFIQHIKTIGNPIKTIVKIIIANIILFFN